MSQSLSKILLHTVFSTKERRPFLRDAELRAELHNYLGGILSNLECQPLLIGGVEDHVHLLFTLSRSQTVAETVKEVKRSSSVWIKAKTDTLGDFAWQNGYGAFSIGLSQLAAAKRYVANQERHHKRIGFQEEYRTFLDRYQVAYDERYVWD